MGGFIIREILFSGKTKTKWVYGSLILVGTYRCILESEKGHISAYLGIRGFPMRIIFEN